MHMVIETTVMFIPYLRCDCQRWRSYCCGVAAIEDSAWPVVRKGVTRKVKVN